MYKRQKKDSTAPNNRLVNNMAKYITDTATGYFIGKPVVYSSQNDAYLEALQDIFDYNDEQDENMELANGASINGDCLDVYKRQAYERGYRKGYGEGLEDGTVEIHSHIDVYLSLIHISSPA